MKVKGLSADSGVSALNQYKQITADYRTILDALPNAVAVFRDSDGCLIMANRKFCEEFDLPVATWADAGRFDLLELSPRSGSGPPGSEHLRLRINDNGDIQFETSDGLQSRLKADVKRVKCGGGVCWLVATKAGLSQDSFEMESPSEQEPYRALVENLNDIVYTTDENAVVTYVSPNVRRLAGYESSEVIGKNFTEFVHPDDLPGRIEQFLKILCGANQASEYRLFTKSGEVKWARTSARPILQNGRVTGVQGVLVDISDRKIIEEALKCSEEKYRLLVQHAKDAIFVVQEDSIRFMNPRASEILGCTFDCIADQPFWTFVYPDDRDLILDRYRRRLSGEKLSDQVSFRIRNKNGAVKDVDMNSVLITWEEKPAIINFLRDMTVQKMMEVQLRNSQKMEALGTLAGGIAHNFNNLLMGIHGNVSLLLTKQHTSSIAGGYLEKIIRLVQSGSRLTEQLLDYARRGSVEVRTVDLNRLVKDVSETLMATRKQIRVHHKLGAKLPYIKADRAQIEQVLLNLLLNAADAMPDGGDVVIETSRYTAGPTKENSSPSCNKDYVLIKVSDQGVGIPGKILDRVFEPFFTTKGLGQGTGLGLSTAYGIVKNHGGEIFVESEVDKGSCFFIYLPAQVAEADGLDPPVTCKSVAGKGTILIVDDESAVLGPSSKLLQRYGFKVLKASSGATALEIFLENWETIDLVILDLIMPKMSGKDLFYKIKEINPDVKVLLSSGFNMSGDAEELLGKGCCGFIQKPYDINHLAAKIMEIL